MKIKDLPKDKSLLGIRFTYPGYGKAYYWHSQWPKGVWGKRKPSDSQVFPLFCDNLEQALDWVIVPTPASS